MAITATPARAVGSAIGSAWKRKWLILAVVVVVGLTALALALNGSRGQSKISSLTTPVAKPVIAQAGVVPGVQQKLGFSTGGVIKRIAVAEGDRVRAGDVLASLDTADLELKVQEADASLTLQQALIAQSAEPPSPADLNAAKVALASAIAKQKDVEGGATAGDLSAAREAVAAARAGVASAQAQLGKATAPATASDVAAAEANARAAQAQIAAANQKLSDALAQPRPDDLTAARLAVDQAKNTLWAQQISRDATCGTFGSNSTQCKSGNASVAASETGVQTAQTNLDKASQPATADQLAADQQAVRSAEAELTSAREALAKVKAGPPATDRDTATAQVDQATSNVRSAQAKLDQLAAGSTDAERAAAESAVEQARATLAKLTADPSPATIDVSKAKLHQAEVTLAEAQLTLQNAVVRAPFDGQVTSVVLKEGDTAAPGATLLTLADLSTLRFETKDLDEVSASKVHVGQLVTVTVPALDKRTFGGTVTAIGSEPAITTSGDVNYVAKITLRELPTDLRWGQTARVEFKQE